MRGSMKRFFLCGFVALFLFNGVALGQSSTSVENRKQQLSSIPQEKVFAHHNATLFFVGEYLYYKLYVINAQNGKLSSISKLAYVALVNEDMERVFEHKVFLENSSGQGDFFIPPDIPTGEYKFVAYTQWMRNGNKNDFFQSSITIINPYRSTQVNSSVSNNGYSILEKSNTSTQNISVETTQPAIKISTDQELYGSRSKVSLKLQYEDNALNNGTYSLSVRKIDNITRPESSAPKLSNTTNKLVKPSEVKYLPEIRGEIITGRIESFDNKASLDDIKVSISLPEEKGYQFKVVSTDTQGQFSASLDKKYVKSKVYAQIMGDARMDYRIVLNELTKVDYPDMIFEKIRISPNLKEMIIERSVHNQIENSYFSVKPDSIKPLSPYFSVDLDKMTTYNLDEYTRFSTIRETLIEVVDLVWSKRVADGKFIFQVKPQKYDFYTTNDLAPLVIMDGIQVQDQTSLLSYNARNVKRISFLRDKYIIGPEIFQGVVLIETIDRDYIQPYLGAYSSVLSLNAPQSNKQYYKQKYTSENLTKKNKLLDFRYQLLWEPNLILIGGEANLEFYTSDIFGEFEIVLAGFSEKGKPYSVRQIITVR